MRLLVLIVIALVDPVFASDADSCLKCHESADFKGKSDDEIAAAIKDTEIRAHRKYRKLTDEEIQAIVDAFSR